MYLLQFQEERRMDCVCVYVYVFVCVCLLIRHAPTLIPSSLK